MSRPRVVVAHGESAARESAASVARRLLCDVVVVVDGDSAKSVLLSQPPVDILVVDVALPRLLGYELCEVIRAQRLSTHAILIASVYSKTAYKRSPSSLYGAADYVEQHHIADKLGDKIAALLPEALPGGAGGERRSRALTNAEAATDAIRQEGEDRLSFTYATTDQARERAQNLARLLVADIVLYCGADVENWRQTGVMPPGLARDFAEGQRLFELRVPLEVRAQHEFFSDAVEQFLRRGDRR